MLDDPLSGYNPTWNLDNNLKFWFFCGVERKEMSLPSEIIPVSNTVNSSGG
jgi:hypothetical protein